MPRKFPLNHSSRTRQQAHNRFRKMLIETCETRMLLATVPVQIDLRTTPLNSDPAEVTTVGAITYFTADDGVNGRELWKTDGTSAGTQLVKDIYPGQSSSNIKGLANVNGSLFFAAVDHNTGSYGIWKSNGTAVGTTLIDATTFSDVSDNNGTFNPVTIGTTYYFTGYYGSNGSSSPNGSELWRATASAVTLVADIGGATGSNPQLLTPVGSSLYFMASEYGTTGYELWKTDGVTTAIVKDINPSNPYYGSYIKNLTNVGGTLYFSADDGSGTGEELWKSNGTFAGTTLVKDINSGPTGSYLTGFTALGTTLFFSANDGINGAELWKSNGAEATTMMVKDIAVGPYSPNYSSNPGSFATLGGSLFFAADDLTGRSLWRSGGTDATTTKVSNFDLVDNPSGLVTVGSTIYFYGFGPYDGAGNALWKFDGTNPSLVADILPASDDMERNGIVSGTGGAYFSVATPESGRELWISNGTSVGTTILKDINASDNGSDPTDTYSWNGWTYFFAYNETVNTAFYRTNGIQTELLHNDMSGGTRSYAAIGSVLYFTDGYQLWKTDGTAAGTTMVDGLFRSAYPEQLTVLNNTLYFVAQQESGYTVYRGRELWTTDGTQAGTKMVKDVNRGANSSGITGLIAIGNTLYFAADDGTGKGQELYKSDGTTAGTVLVKDIYAGPDGSTPVELFNYNGTLIFAAQTLTNGYEVFKSDGTSVGTTILKDIYLGSTGSTPRRFTTLGASLYFKAYDEFDGWELFKSDGTGANTVKVESIDGTGVGFDNSADDAFITVGSFLYFEARDDASSQGRELWRTDGTAAGTVLVKDINTTSGYAGSYPERFVNVGGTLFFTADDGVNGRELWRSNGTGPGTVLAHDAFPGLAGASPNAGDPTWLTALGNTLIYTATTITPTESGRELYALVGNQAPTIAAPASRVTSEDVSVVFSSALSTAITVGDIDLEGAPIRITLTGTNGTVTLASLSGLTFTTGDGTTDATMTFTGLPAAVNTALNGLTFAPTANFNGAASLTVTANDQGASGIGGAQQSIVTIPITVEAVNDNPTSTGPAAAQTFNEDANRVFNAANSNLISIADVDSSTAQVTLNSTLGALTLSQVTGLTFTGGDGTLDSAMTFSGTIANINAALNNLTYTPNANANGTGVLTLNVSDLGNTGAGGVKTTSRTINLNLTSINDAPVNTVPVAQSTLEDVTKVFSLANGNAISVADVEIGANPLQITLTAAGGTITLGQLTGLSFSVGDGTSDATMTFTGTAANVNAALNGLSYIPTTNSSGAGSLQIVTSDQGQAGTGGTLTDSDTIAITVASVNDLPVLTGVNTESLNEDTSRTFNSANSNLISVSDPDVGAGTLRLILGAQNGAITIGANTSTSFTFTDTPANLNALLDGMIFTPALNFSGAAGINFTLSDQGNTGGPANIVSAFEAITVNALNDAPVNTLPQGIQFAQEDVATTFSAANGNLISIADVESSTAQVTLTANKGALSLATIAGLAFTAGDGVSDATMTFSGSLSAINTALNGLVHVPTGNINGAATIVIATSDLGNAGSGGVLTDTDTLNISITAVNDTPGVNGPATATVDKNITYPFNTTTGRITLADIDTTSAEVRATVTATNGTVSLTSLAGLTFLTGDGTSDATMVILGSITSINTALNNATFVPNAGYAGPASVTVAVNDQGNSGIGGPKSATKTIAITVLDSVLVDQGRPGYAEAGSWALSGFTGHLGTTTRFSASTAATSTWTPTLPSAGTYRVEFYKIPNASSNPNATVTINANGSNFILPMNFQTGTAGFVDLGTYTFSGSGTEFLRLSQSTAGTIRADAVRFVRLAAAEIQVIDFGSAGYAEVGAWVNSGLLGFDGSTTRYATAATATARWTPTTPLVGTYKVEFYKVVNAASTTNATVTISASGTNTPFAVNFTTGVSGFVDLGNFTFSGIAGEFVTLSQSANGTMRADAVRFTKIS